MKNNMVSKGLVFGILVLFVGAGIVPGISGGTRSIIYVDDDAVGTNNGSSWENAFTELQSALAIAQSGDEIWVAAGVYKPDYAEDKRIGEMNMHRTMDSGRNGGHNRDQTMSFCLVDGVVLYGGYAGFGAPDPDERNISLYETILSGDLNGDDGPNFENYGDNSYHVVLGGDIYNPGTILDGVTIRSGYANSSTIFYQRGGGMYIYRAIPTISNCTFIANAAKRGGPAGEGGGIHIVSTGNATIKHCRFIGNDASSGGGMYIRYGSTPTVINCEFIENSAGGGGGVESFVSIPMFIRCRFSSNTANISGGGMNINGGRATIVKCFFENNTAGDRGGGIENSGIMTLANCWFVNNSAWYGSGILQYAFSNCNMTLTNCIFMNHPGAAILNRPFSIWYPTTTLIGCTLVNNGAGLVDWGDFPTQLRNCIVWGNGAGQQEAQISGAGIMVNYCCIQGWNGSFGGIGNFGEDPLFVNPNIDNYHLSFNSPCIDTGDPEYISDPNEEDIDGQPRVVDGNLDGLPVVDIGADEFFPGDLDGDGDVDLSDLATLLVNYGTTSGATYEMGDLDGDGDVDLSDLAALLGNYGIGI